VNVRLAGLVVAAVGVAEWVTAPATLALPPLQAIAVKRTGRLTSIT
jgi:hypothetical protein